MLNQEMLLELTESYLKSLVAETSVSLGTDFDSSAPFAQSPTPAPDTLRKMPIRLLEKDLFKHPELEALVKALFERYKNEGCVSRGTRNIAPNLFIGSDRKGYFNYSRSKNIVLVYAYTGPEDYFPEIAREMYRYCAEKDFQLNLFALDEVIESIDGIAFSATPFGALQRLLDIQNFTLEGGAMRRLRYQVAKFEKAGACRTQAYQCGTDKEVDRGIAEVIDRWCATKTMVNPLIHVVREEILLFPTCIYHQIDKGFTPHELPHAEVFRLDSAEVYKANLDWDALRDCVARQADELAYVCIEVSDNAAGGHPVSVQHLKQVKELLAGHSIPLVIDGTRILENAQFLIEREKPYADRTLWDVAGEILSYADVVIGGLTKDFCVN